MDTAQEVAVPLEKGKEIAELENEPSSDLDIDNCIPENETNESTQMQWDVEGKCYSRILLQKKRVSSHLSRLNTERKCFSERLHDHGFSFSNDNEEEAEANKKCPRPCSTLCLSDKLIHSPRDKRKAPSSPVHNRFRPRSFFPDSSSGLRSSLKVASLRKNLPSVNAAWIQPKTGFLRNTWSSRSDAILPVTVVSTDSPCSSPQLHSSDRSVDIIIKPPTHYLRRRLRKSFESGAHLPFPISCEKDVFTTTPSPIVTSRNQSISPFDRDSFNESGVDDSPLPPYSSTPNLLSVSHDLTPDELQPPSETIYMNVSISKKRPSILPSSISDIPLPENTVICDTLVDIGDCPSSGSFPSYSCQQDLDEFDFSNLQIISTETPLSNSDIPVLSAHSPTSKSESTSEELANAFNFLMDEEEKEKSKIKAWDGEELKSGELGNDDDMLLIGDSYTELTSISPQPSISIELSPLDSESPEPELSESTSSSATITREPTPVPCLTPPPSPVLSTSNSSLAASSVDDIPPPESNVNVMEMEFNDMLDLLHEPRYDYSSLSPLLSSPSPPPPYSKQSSPEPGISTDYSMEIAEEGPMENPEVTYEPTDTQIRFVEREREKREEKYQKKDREEEERRKEVMSRAYEVYCI